MSDSTDLSHLIVGWRYMSSDEITNLCRVGTMRKLLAKHAPQMNPHQLKALFSSLLPEELTEATPTLGLEQQNFAVLVVHPKYLAAFYNSLSLVSRNSMQKSIQGALPSGQTDPDPIAERKRIEELQSVIGFVDPLTIGVALFFQPSLLDQIVPVTHVLNIEQLKVFMPLLSMDQVFKVLSILETEEAVAVAVQRIHPDVREELIRKFRSEIDGIEEQMKTLQEQTGFYSSCATVITAIIVGLFGTAIAKWTQTHPAISADYYNTLKTDLQTVRSGLDSLNRTLTEFSDESLAFRWRQIDDMIDTHLIKTVRRVTIDIGVGTAERPGAGVLLAQAEPPALSPDYWLGIDPSEPWKFFTNHDEPNFIDLQEFFRIYKIEAGEISAGRPSAAAQSQEDAYADEDISIALFEAVKSIGNPSAIGEAYKISWNQIIKAGFRTAADFKQKNISTLQQLNDYILKADQPV